MISIVIPAYKEEKHIADTLDSIKKNRFQDYEIIVIVNGVKDSAFDIAKRYTDRVFFIEDAHVSKARNLGAKKAKGDIISFLDADTKLSRNALEEISKNAGYVSTLKVKHYPDRLKYLPMRIIKNFFIGHNLYITSNGIISLPKSTAEKISFDENKKLGEDTKYILSAARHIPFKMIRTAYAKISMRRYERWGLVRSLIFWTFYRDKEKEYSPVR